MKKILTFLFFCTFLLKNEHAQNSLISKNTFQQILSDYIHRNTYCYDYKHVKCCTIIKPFKINDKIYLSFTAIGCSHDLPKDATKYYKFSDNIFFIRPFENNIFYNDIYSLFIDSVDSINLDMKSYLSMDCASVYYPDIYLYQIKKTVVRKSFIIVKRKRFWPYDSCPTQFWPIDEFYSNVMLDNRYQQIDKEVKIYQSSKDSKFTHFKTLRVVNK